MTSKGLNYLTDSKEIFNVIEIKNLGVLVNINKELNDIESNQLNYFWGTSSFKRPNMFNELFKEEFTLKVIVDNSFSIEPDDKNFIFLDHHLTEEYYKNPFTSNTRMLIENYNILVSMFNEFKNRGYKKIVTLYHNDGDGVMSSIVMKLVYQEVFNDIILEKSEKNKMFSMIKLLGDTYDVSFSRDDIFNDLNKLKLLEDSGVFIKKIQTITKGLSMYYKTIRNSINNESDSIYTEIDHLTEQYGKPFLMSMVNGQFENYYYNLINMDNPLISVVQVLSFLNLINNDKYISDMIDIYEQEKTRIVNQFVYPNTTVSSVFDMIIEFKKFPKKYYRLFIFSSPFDLARTVSWSIFGKMNYYKKTSKKNDWSFYLDDYNITKLKKLNERNCVLNVSPNGKSKLSLNDFVGDTAYRIAKEVFNGGGHNNEKDSIGSVELSESDFYKEINIIKVL